MEWEQVKKQLETVLNAPMQLITLLSEEWNRLATAQQAHSPRKSVVKDHAILFYLQQEAGQVIALQVSEVLLTSTERQLVEIMIESKQSLGKKQLPSFLSEDEKKANQLREWLLQNMERGSRNVELPDSLASQAYLYSTKIPLLLYGDYSQNQKVSYAELKKLLDSFFDAEITLIPLQKKEWLILGSEQLLAGGSSSEEREEDEEESLEQMLDAMASGLYEMLANEWVGECHLAIHYPMKPAKNLLSTVVQLRETIMLGRTFHIGSNIHLPWQLHLEKLMHLIADDEKIEFLERVLGGIDHVLDTETQTTLEQFFSLDCNVSETAKKLYIHRNTLLYRLDKFKQETGLDVRTFNHAVLVKISILLYKVTKRK